MKTQTLVRLRSGEVYRFHGDAADRVRVVAGRVCLVEPPQWLADEAVAARQAMAAEDSRRCGRRGWFGAEAETAAVVEILRPAAARAALRGVWLTALLRRWRQDPRP